MEDIKISKELFNEITNSNCHEVFIKNEFVIAHSNLGMKIAYFPFCVILKVYYLAFCSISSLNQSCE